jgi:hypothetical protein
LEIGSFSFIRRTKISCFACTGRITLKPLTWPWLNQFQRCSDLGNLGQWVGRVQKDSPIIYYVVIRYLRRMECHLWYPPVREHSALTHNTTAWNCSIISYYFWPWAVIVNGSDFELYDIQFE